VRECQRVNVRLLEYRQRFPRQPPLEAQGQHYRLRAMKAAGSGDNSAPRAPPGLLPARRRSPVSFRVLPSMDKRDATTPGPRASPARDTDPTTSTCFSCGEVGHFASSCPNPRKTPKINRITYEDDDALGGDEATDEDNNEAVESEN
jgi:hypothetical protein